MVYVIIVVILITLIFVWQNNNIVISNHNYNSKKIPDGFNGFKIVHTYIINLLVKIRNTY